MSKYCGQRKINLNQSFPGERTRQRRMLELNNQLQSTLNQNIVDYNNEINKKINRTPNHTPRKIVGLSFFNDDKECAPIVLNGKKKQPHKEAKKYLETVAKTFHEPVLPISTEKNVIKRRRRNGRTYKIISTWRKNHLPSLRNRLRDELITPPETKNIFFFDGVGIPLEVRGKIINITELQIWDDLSILDHQPKPTQHSYHIAIENRRSPTGNFIAGKVSRQSCSENGICFLKDYIEILNISMKVKNHISRGRKREAVTERMICFGNRKDPLSNGISHYSFSPGKVSAEDQKYLTNKIHELLKVLENKAKLVLNSLPDTNKYNFMTEYHKFPTMTEENIYTQFCIAQNYWSPMHADDDYYYCTLSVFNENATSDKEILYHFCFPEYRIAIPLRQGDILVFDPRTLHCATNPRIKDSYIVSAYTSMKTINTHTAQTMSNH